DAPPDDGDRHTNMVAVGQPHLPHDQPEHELERATGDTPAQESPHASTDDREGETQPPVAELAEEPPHPAIEPVQDARAQARVTQVIDTRALAQPADEAAHIDDAPTASDTSETPALAAEPEPTAIEAPHQPAHNGTSPDPPTVAGSGQPAAEPAAA